MSSGWGGVLRGVRAVPLTASRFLFGRDFFISYSRRDAAAYSATLASRLSKHFSCYLDQLATPRGEKLPAPIARELKRATTLVLVGSPGAIESLYVPEELQLFLETGRPLLLLDIDAALDRAPWDRPPWSNLAGVYREPESLDAFARADPSPALLDYLRDSFTFTKQDRRLRLASTTSAVLLATVPISATLSVLARRRAAEASRRATQAQAEEAAARASAEEQRRIALSRRLAGESGGQISERPDLGLLLAAMAHDVHPTAEARRALFRGLTFHPGLSRLIRDPEGGETQGLTASADGRYFVTGGHETITVWDGSSLRPRTRIQEKGENFRGFALSPDGSLLAACRSQHVTLVDAATGRVRGRIEAATDIVSFVGQGLLATGVDIWDVSAPDRPVVKSRLSLEEGIETLAGDPGGRFVVAATSKRMVLCSPSPFRVEGTLTDARAVGLTTLALSPNPEAPLVAATNLGGRLAVWSLESGERVASLSLVGGLGDRDLSRPGTSPGGDMFAVVFSRDGERVTAGSLRGRFATGTVEELATWSTLQQAPAEMRDSEMALFGMSGDMGLRQFVYAPGIQALAYVGEPPRLVALQMDTGLSVWDDQGRSPLEHLSPWPDERAAHATHTFSTDGRYALGRDAIPAVPLTEFRLHVWPIGGTGPPLNLEPALINPGLDATAISKDGHAIAGFVETGVEGSWPTLALWDSSGTLRSRTPIDASLVPGIRRASEPVAAVFGGPTQSLLLATAFSNGAIATWDVADLSKPRLLGVRTTAGRLAALAISPVRRELAIAGERERCPFGTVRTRRLTSSPAMCRGSSRWPSRRTGARSPPSRMPARWARRRAASCPGTCNPAGRATNG